MDAPELMLPSSVLRLTQKIPLLYLIHIIRMAIVAQLARALDCGSKCRGFEPRRSPFFLLFL